MTSNGFKYDVHKATYSSSYWEYTFKDMTFYIKFTRHATVGALGSNIYVTLFYKNKKTNLLTDIATHGSYKRVMGLNREVIALNSNFRLDDIINRIKTSYHVINALDKLPSLEKILDEMTYMLESNDLKIEEDNIGIIPMSLHALDALSDFQHIYSWIAYADYANVEYEDVNGKTINVGYAVALSKKEVKTQRDVELYEINIMKQVHKLGKKLNLKSDVLSYDSIIDFEELEDYVISCLFLYIPVYI